MGCLSRATVSRVVNDGAGVRAEVRQAIEEPGYVPHLAARTPVTHRNGAVAVVIADPESRVFSDPFFAQRRRGISKELSATGSQLVLDQTVAVDRLIGWRDALLDAADPELVIEGDFTVEGGGRAMARLLVRRLVRGGLGPAQALDDASPFAALPSVITGPGHQPP